MPVGAPGSRPKVVQAQVWAPVTLYCSQPSERLVAFTQLLNEYTVWAGSTPAPVAVTVRVAAPALLLVMVPETGPVARLHHRAPEPEG